MNRKHPLAECETCPLNEDGRFVPSYGPEKADLVVVGEAPGLNEVIKGRPFIGQSGMLLDKVLDAHDIPRDRVFYTNVCLCRPPDNATPPKAAIRACAGRLFEEVRTRRADGILLLGSTAGQTVLESTDTITNLRVGPPKVSPSFPGSRIIATWHPAYCLRNADAFPTMASDIGKLNRTVREWIEPVWRAYEDPDEAVIVLKQLSELLSPSDLVVCDIETGLDKDVSFDHPNNYDLLCVGLAYAPKKAVVIGEEACKDDRVLDALATFLRDHFVVYHNGKFDTSGLWPIIGDLPISGDTMLASYALDERPGLHSLEHHGVETMGAPNWKLVIARYRKSGESYAVIPRPILYKYNAFDDCITYDLWNELAPQLDEVPTDWPYPDLPVRTLRDVHDFLCRAAEQLKFLELNGVTFDSKVNGQLAETYLDALEEIEIKLDNIAREDSTEPYEKNGKSPAWINPRSPKQIQEYFHSHSISVPSTDEDTLKQLQTKLRPNSNVGRFISELLIHRRRQKLYGTYVKGMRSRVYRGRIFTTYSLHGTTSGRLASKNPNLQNIVRDKAIRNQFTVASPENVLIQADGKQAEGRIITWLAQSEDLRVIFADPTRDLFNELSDRLYGEGNWNKDRRVRTKAYFYGIAYGRQPYSIAQEYGFSPREAESDYARFMQAIPDVARWQEDIKAQVLRGDDLVTPFGRRRRFWLITDQNQKDVLNEALSYLPQSTASDIFLSSLVHLRPMLRGLGWIRLTLHDALVVECKETEREQVTEMMRDVILAEANKIQTYAPFEVDVTYGKYWGEL